MKFRSTLFSILAACTLSLAVFAANASAGGSTPTYRYTIKNDTDNGACSDTCYNMTISKAVITFTQTGTAGRSSNPEQSQLSFTGIEPGSSSTDSKTVSPRFIRATVEGRNGFKNTIMPAMNKTSTTITLTSKCQLTVN